MTDKRWFNKRAAARKFALLFAKDDLTFTVKELEDAFDKVTETGVSIKDSDVLGGLSLEKSTIRSSVGLWLRDTTIRHTHKTREGQRIYRICLTR